ncbi:predicted protein [Uncinocarpus reesii 1704]|uniref:Uncharacterized protein n=1 Tax=Uncinocarpus reesii (strain UAMH 1704) TaxID=336963 RepID=C4JVS8_UNCRE|nr:uncharacterized protein UREG_06670 [Uncinocarpus reesii 1704]EEP81805.1 predicted protein [Uncinocarpus reesii 1704]
MCKTPCPIRAAPNPATEESDVERRIAFPGLFAANTHYPEVAHIVASPSTFLLKPHRQTTDIHHPFTMPSAVKLYAAIDDNDGGVFNHWSFFIDGPQNEGKLVFQAMGSAGRFRFESKNADSRLYPNLIELFYVAEIDAARIKDVQVIAENLPIPDSTPGWNCQDYVLDLFKALERDGLVDKDDDGYRARYSELWRKQDGLA